jgi:8-oxo-dGTP diphosphatase
VVLLTDDQGRIAMQLRDDKPGLPAANQWGLFGGLIESHETAKDVALREIQEELGIRLDPDRLSLHRHHYIPEQNLTTWIFHYPVTDELDHAVLREGQTWDFIAREDPRVDEIGLHHHQIVLDFWADQS